MSYDIQQTREEAEKAAAVKGCVCRVPAANELFLDIDSHEAFYNFEPAVCFVHGRRAYGGVAVLGSDPMRELLNLRRLINDVPNDANNILFEVPA